MDLASFLRVLVSSLGVLVFLILLIWVPTEILRKAGFPRWYAVLAVLVPPAGFFGLIAFALSEWPIHRELAWLRLRAGDTSGDGMASVEGYALDLERRGEWKRAVEVYKELARQAPTAESAEYYRNCSQRLHEKMGEVEIT